MKSLSLVSKAALIFLLAFNFNLFAFPSTSAGGSITMEDEIMMTTSVNSSHGTISQIDIYDLSGNLVSTIIGCGASQCTTNLSKLVTATYDVQITSSTGFNLSGLVYVDSSATE